MNDRILIFSGKIFTVLFFFLFCSCSSSGVKKENKQEEVSAPKTFVLPEIPVTLTSPEGRAEYLVRHYWDNFDFADTTYINLPQITEQAFVNYLEIFPHTTKDAVHYSIHDMLSKAQSMPEMQKYIVSLYDKYLYDPNSPMRNEDYYLFVLEQIINSDKTNETDLKRANYRFALISKNRIGEKATNITYTLVNGKSGRLYNIKSDYTILMFYNPDCHTCGEIINFLKTSPLITCSVNNKKVTILAFYADEDLEIWKKHLSDIPSSWINGYDKEQVVNTKELYDLKAIPALYLLDKDKKVLLKDAPFEVIERYLWNELQD